MLGRLRHAVIVDFNHQDEELLRRMAALKRHPSLYQLLGVVERFRVPFTRAIATLGMLDFSLLPFEKMQVMEHGLKR